MRNGNVTIEDYVGMHRILTAAEVRALPVGSHVLLHSFDRYGAHCTVDLQVAQASPTSKRKMLTTVDYYGTRIIKPITDRQNMCYTEV